MHILKVAELFVKNIFVYLQNKHNYRDRDVWVFGEWFGMKCGDNSTHLANYVAKENPALKIIWVCNEKCNTEELDASIRVMHFNDNSLQDVLKRASVVIMSQGYLDLSIDGYNYFGNAVTVNLWHGILWKTIGFDTYNQRNILIKLYTLIMSKVQSYTAFISVSDSYTEKFAKAFRINDAVPILSGYPRNEVFYNKDLVAKNREKVLDLIHDVHGNSAPRIVAYMPTYRKNEHNFSFEELVNDENFVDTLCDLNVYIIQKLHFASVRTNENKHKEHNSRVVSVNNIDPQVLLSSADVLITDYSGCFYDYLLLDRPIIHYMYDYDEYANEKRGLYYSSNDVCAGEIVRSRDQLLSALVRAIENPDSMKKRRQAVRSEYMKYEIPDSCAEIYKQVCILSKRGGNTI